MIMSNISPLSPLASCSSLNDYMFYTTFYTVTTPPDFRGIFDRFGRHCGKGCEYALPSYLGEFPIPSMILGCIE